MATLTYNPDESVQGELTAEEQESLQVGEQLEQAAEQQLAGKFKNAEELEKAYIELQSKLGESKPEPEVPQPTTETESEPKEEEKNFLESLWEEANASEMSQETLERLNKMNPGELAKMYLEYRANQRDESTQKGDLITPEQAGELRNLVGGDKAYGDMMGWAKSNLTENEIAMYDYVMEQGNPASMYFAIQALNSKFVDSNGKEGRMLTGKVAATKADAFRSQAEVVRAMSDPRYDSDPAYRQDVAAKLERSDVNF